MQIQAVRILDSWTDQGRQNTDVVVKFEYHVPPDNGFHGGDVWTGTVHFSETAEPYELEIVKQFDSDYGPILPEPLTAGRFHEAVCVDEVLYIFMRSPEERRVFEPVLVAAREYFSRISSNGGNANLTSDNQLPPGTR